MTPPSAEALNTQLARAAQPGRGRSSDAPSTIPARGWWDILYRTAQETANDRILAIAAGAAFYGLLALFPAVTALVSSYGLFASWATASDHLATLASVLPPGAFSVIQDQITRILATNNSTLSWAFAVSICVALWGANAGMKAAIDALNVVYDEKEKRSFIVLNIVSLTMTAGMIILGCCAIALLVVTPILLNALALGQSIESGIALARWPLLFLGMMFSLAVLYRFGPSRRMAKWRWITPGAALASAVWLAASSGLSFYFSHFANYDAVYGSLGGLMALLIWMWMSAIVVLMGAELNSEIEHQTARDTTEGLPKPIGARGAVMADTVGEAAS
ncbi:MAG: YihY/virulence factor BrkB family protein [Rhizobiales bacterium]|nr:YihY/virulence factor BrkB family protein [Hyphomicrobiales bacterium]